jgi:hypothetical protein
MHADAIVPMAPDAKRSVAEAAIGTSASLGGVSSTASTVSTSPTSTRARSKTCVVCSITCPPERWRSDHQAHGGRLAIQ